METAPSQRKVVEERGTALSETLSSAEPVNFANNSTRWTGPCTGQINSAALTLCVCVCVHAERKGNVSWGMWWTVNEEMKSARLVF